MSVQPHPLPAVTYRAGRTAPVGPATVSVHHDGNVTALTHHRYHSRDGFQWGYHGAGPADLARSLLLHAWGPAAYCPYCNPNRHVPQPGEARTVGCRHCTDGLTDHVADYQNFVANVIAHITADRWETTSADVRYHGHPTTFL